MTTFPARGTWIEIPPRRRRHISPVDVPRKGNVDRNERERLPTVPLSDVPRKGNVDRNFYHKKGARSKNCDVPRKGNVDRNSNVGLYKLFVLRTFPARGTWIEISISS